MRNIWSTVNTKQNRRSRAHILTTVWIMLTRSLRIWLVSANTSTTFSASAWSSKQSTAMNAPVRPTPALHQQQRRYTAVQWLNHQPNTKRSHRNSMMPFSTPPPSMTTNQRPGPTFGILAHFNILLWVLCVVGGTYDRHMWLTDSECRKLVTFIIGVCVLHAIITATCTVKYQPPRPQLLGCISCPAVNKAQVHQCLTMIQHLQDDQPTEQHHSICPSSFSRCRT